MSRLSIRPRPLDIHKKLPIVKSVKDFDDYEDIPASTSTRNSQILRIAAAEVDNEVQLTPSRKLASEIPTPQFDVVDTYERDYSCTFSQPASYLRGRGAWAEMGEFVEYDLDNEDEDWLQNLNSQCEILTPEQFESLLFKFEVLDHKARERAGVMTLGLPIPVFLQLDAVFENLQAQVSRYSVFQAVFIYWKDKRDRWRKPVLRRLQPPPPVNDTNPYNVFRPREKAHRLHTRRMQRRENNVQSFDKLRQVRRNLDQAKTVLEALIKREERKRDVVENEINIQRIQLQYKYEPEVLEDSLAFPGFNNFPYKLGLSEDEFMDSEDVTNRLRHATISNAQFAGYARRDSKLQPTPHGWLHNTDPNEPLLLFTKPLDAQKLAGAGIVAPPPTHNQVQIRGRMGRGGRIMFDRCDPLLLAYSH